ncbi:glutathione S-transferase N-terminal domain-containing protein [Stenotrophomonas sp. CFBP8980]|uniref:glutathione S-transferase N-terminal domain-containing protein n=1 Tax=Stenotrophomonas sp. CFBP8980 TaxID=3096523 RepID=UPI002A6B564F|nr:glutathione S-transferase N-terminal domain-containing protein [Stenotrophomonas sp. CFBP8980]MDY1035203.1 glutathione S-transferase N-terminal domain-containing protein [Stenotrophomonas sp. CFBP8980]
MKLYSKPGACSTADHIALQWTGQPFEVELLDRETLKSPAFLKINPVGSVPALVDGDFVLTQNAAIMGYIADTHPQAGLAGDGSPRQRAEAARWLSFVNSDLHPAFAPLFAPGKFLADEGQRAALAATAHKRLRGLFEQANAQLADKPWLAGFRSFADPYFYITLRWAAAAKVDLSGLEHLAAYKTRMDADAGVQAVLKAEGLA